MGYTKTLWVDQNVQRPKTYEVTNNQDGSITLTDSFGLVTELGTPVNAQNMNHIENALALCDLTQYDASVTYSTGEWVTGVVNSKKGVFASKTDNNTGNALSNTTYWEEVQLGGGTRNIGEIVASTIPLTDAGLHLLDGALITDNGAYADFVNYIAGLYDDDPTADYFETEANWQTAVTTYGVCGKFVYDSVNNTVRLPKITGFVEGTIDPTTLGDLVEAGLPNITGSVYNIVARDIYGANALSGTYQSASNIGTTGSSYYTYNTISVDASQSNSIYGNSATVQPQAVKVLYYIVIATTEKTAIEVDIDEISTDLNGKLDTDLTNMAASQSAKNTIMGWGMPDYENAISATGLYTATNKFIAPCDGVLIYIPWYNAIGALYVNNIIVGGYYGSNQGNGQDSPLVLPLSKNDEFYCENAVNIGTVANSRFIPLKGAN